jgi:tRNA pseudouridine38-40 synthase
VRVVKLVIGFDGTRYEGWQSQRKNKTIQETFQQILARVLNEPVHVTGSSRTDSGVHAKALVAHFKTRSDLPDHKIKSALNFYLPRDILVYSARTVSGDFHARFHAKSKIYEYAVWNAKDRPLFEAPYVWWCPYHLNVSRMKTAAKYFFGKHDFSAFRDGGADGRNSIRTISRISIKKKGAILRIRVEGDGFLRHMVRVLVGTLIEVGRGRLEPAQIPRILASKDRKNAGPTAQACGLTLTKVSY